MFFFLVSIVNHAYKFIDLGFAELRFAMVLRLPRPQGERGTEHVCVRAHRR
jgi:hypothetical protein